ncbi:MAG: MFS transporter [Verrucomicrobiae bacterium]
MPEQPQSPSSPAGQNSRIPLWRALVYGLGSLAGLGGAGMNSLSLNIFNITLGVDVALITSAMGIVQFVGILLDPVIANFSDNFLSRWGRRRPLLMVGGVIGGLSFAAVWMFPPTGWSQHQYFLWYLGFSLVLNLGNSMYGAGYFALGIEIASDYQERTRVMAIRSYFSTIAALAGPWLFFLCQLSIFASALMGARWIGAIIGAVVIGAAIPCAIFTRERFVELVKKEAEPIKSPWEPVVNFFKTVISIGNNRYFWMLLGAAVTLCSGLSLFEQLGNYVTYFYVFHGDTVTGSQFTGWGNTLGVALSIFAIPLAQKLCNQLGKHVVLRMALGWMLLGSALKWWCYNPHYPYLIFVIPFFYSVGISSFWMILPAMQADVVDIDELRSGKRREAMFGAVTSLGFRASSAISIILMGLILKATGFVRALGGNQPPETFLRMRFLYSFAMAATLLISLLFIFKYDLTAKKMEDVRKELERRRANV